MISRGNARVKGGKEQHEYPRGSRCRHVVQGVLDEGPRIAEGGGAAILRTEHLTQRLRLLPVMRVSGEKPPI